MEIRRAIDHGTIINVTRLLATQRRSDALLFLVIFVTVFGLTPLLVLAGTSIGFNMVMGGLVALIAAALVVRWPVLGFWIVAGCTVLIEQNPLTVNAHILTDQLYIFAWPPSLTGSIERPIGFFILFIFLVFVFFQLVKRQRVLQGGKLFLPFLFFLLCVAVGVVHGLSSGGDFRIVVLELRPLWYLFLSYLLAYNLVTHKSHIRAFFWIVILGAGVKGVQGVYILLVVLHGNLTGQNEIMSHEESFFFVALLLLLVLFCLHSRYRSQLYAALLVLPFVLVALVANQRRADYIALLVGIGVAWPLVFQVRPRARKPLIVSALIIVTLGAGYVALFSHSGGPLAAPARAIVSIINPNAADARDAASNLYRQIEDDDLKYTVKQNPLLGLGFGKPFLQPELLPNLLSLDPYYNYIPHNTIYWIWMRLGPFGYLAFWYLIGAIIVRGCLIVRQLQDRYLQLVAIYIVSVTFMEIIVAYADYQLFFYRNVIYLGFLVGILLKLPTLDEKKETVIRETTHGVSQPATSNVGS
jgi:hypothetical protein